MIGSFSIVIFILAMLAIYFRLQDNFKLYAVFKPLTTIVVILLAIYANLGIESEYGWLITIGLVFCLLGDVLLLKDSFFVFGLGAFLMAHLLFVFAFSSLHGFQTNPYVIIVLLIIGGSYFKFLYSDLKALAFPVLLYFVAIIVMDWQAISLTIAYAQFSFGLIAIGAVLFSFSDAVIAYEKFKGGFAYSEGVILGTYWLAIFLICIGWWNVV